MEPDLSTTRITKTNLYRLIEAIQEEVAPGPGDDKLVVEVVSQMLREGRIRIPSASPTWGERPHEDRPRSGRYPACGGALTLTGPL